MGTRYYFNKQFYYHFADLCNAYKKEKGYFPMRAYRTEDSKGNPVLAYK